MTEVIYWAGWVGGIGIGLYGIAQFIISGHLLGVSTGFGNVCGLVSKNSFFHTGKYADNFNWRLFFVIGIPLGGLIAALTSPGPLVLSFSLGPLYDSVLPESLLFKLPILSLGGIMIGYGSRLAGGCTSGHSISGLALLNPPSILASAGFFAGGIIMVQTLFGLV